MIAVVIASRRSTPRCCCCCCCHSWCGRGCWASLKPAHNLAENGCGDLDTVVAIDGGLALRAGRGNGWKSALFPADNLVVDGSSHHERLRFGVAPGASVSVGVGMAMGVSVRVRFAALAVAASTSRVYGELLEMGGTTKVN